MDFKFTEKVKKWGRRVKCVSLRALHLILRWWGPGKTYYVGFGVTPRGLMNEPLVVPRGHG